MFLIEFAFAYGLIVLGPSAEDPGVIRGRVVNMSQREAPCARTEVILRARVEGQFAPVAQTLTDADGNYRFEGLPVGPAYLYLPGANREGIHYPGRRVGLTRGQATAYVTLEVRDTVTEPSPLVIRQHEIVIGTEPGAVHVVEALLVDNPTTATYVGRAKSEGMLPVTLQLHIPSDFERVTFEKEQFGSQFQVSDGRLVSGLPWTPGPQWLRFTYSLRAEAIRGVWRRVMDAPCESLRVRVRSSKSEEIGCDLPPVADSPPGEKVFQSRAGVLSAGDEICVRLGPLPLSWIVYARWVTLLLLVGIITGVALMLRRKSHGQTQPAVDAAPSQGAPIHAHAVCNSNRPRPRQRRRAA